MGEIKDFQDMESTNSCTIEGDTVYKFIWYNFKAVLLNKKENVQDTASYFLCKK